jgi:hypothetical protein
MSERRRSSRLRSFLGGRVSYANGRTQQECLIRNLSSRGAKLVFDHAVTLPSEFDLFIHKQQRSFRAKVMWHAEQEVGVRLTPIAVDVSPVKLARKVQILKAENEELRKQISQRGTGKVT